MPKCKENHWELSCEDMQGNRGMVELGALTNTFGWVEIQSSGLTKYMIIISNGLVNSLCQANNLWTLALKTSN